MDNKTTIVTVAVLATIGASYLLSHNYRTIIRKLRTILHIGNALRNQDIQVVSNFTEFLSAFPRLQRDCEQYRVLGFDCEWVTVNNSRRPVALIQLATYTGYCLLIRLNLLQQIPRELKELLEDERIWKVGVVPMDDAKYLALDYGVHVESTLDLRHIAKARSLDAGGLGRMAKTHLNVVMEKDWRVRCSDWGDTNLTEKQISYAATDAHVAIELFKLLTEYSSFCSTQTNQQKILDYEHFLEVKFNVKAALGVAEKKSNSSKSSSKPVKNKNKIAARDGPLYENCRLQAPDGELLCTLDKKKSEWYLSKGLGDLVCESPFTVRLKFEPAGRAVGQVGQYYIQNKENRCVVCGASDSYLRKNVVPREYRKHFPTIMKSHTSHDVVLMCPQCHQRSNTSDYEMRSRLAHQCNAPLTISPNHASEISRLKRVKSAIKALLLHGNKIPLKRFEELRNEVLSYFPPGTELTEDFLKANSEIEIVEANEASMHHGQIVVKYYQEFDGLIAFERLWREHFLKFMKPKYMPNLWSIEHNVQRLEIRVDENRITADEIKLSGLHIDKSNEEYDQRPKMSSDLQGEE